MKLYIDTSVFGGYFETEFQLWTKKLVAEIIDGKYTAVVSDITLFELETAPAFVKQLAEKIITENAEFIASSNEARMLANKYLEEKIVTQNNEPFFNATEYNKEEAAIIIAILRISSPFSPNQEDVR